MSKRANANQATLAYAKECDSAFQDGLRDGYRNQGQEPRLEKQFLNIYRQGYKVGAMRAQRENANGTKLQLSASAPFNPWQYST